MTTDNTLSTLHACTSPAPDTHCTLCDQPLNLYEPWIDWRWAGHDGYVYCETEGHDEQNPFHVECAQALLQAEGAHPYMGDQPISLDEHWLTPILWRTFWDPTHVTVRDAQLAHTVYARIHQDDYMRFDPTMMNPFDAVRYRYESREQFLATDLPAYARCLTLDKREQPYLALVLQPNQYGQWEAPWNIRTMTCNQLTTHVQYLVNDPTIHLTTLKTYQPKTPTIWNRTSRSW